MGFTIPSGFQSGESKSNDNPSSAIVNRVVPGEPKNLPPRIAHNQCEPRPLGGGLPQKEQHHAVMVPAARNYFPA